MAHGLLLYFRQYLKDLIMKRISLLIFVLIATSQIAWAQADKSDVYIVEDLIIEESMKKQGNMDIKQRQEQTTTKQIKELQQKVAGLQKELIELKKQRQMSMNKVVEVEVGHDIKEKKIKGELGRFTIAEGRAQTMVKMAEDKTDKRELPALQVCATMADVNRLSKDDFVFLGLDEQSAQRVIDARERMGQFSSSKQLNAITGVDADLLNTLRPEIMAISEQRFAE